MRPPTVPPSSLLHSLVELPASEREALIATLSPAEAEAIARDWRGLWARPEQLAPPGDWSTWLILAGRGFGKTRTLSEWMREQVEVRGGRRGALCGRTSADVRDVLIEGESGILAISPSWNRPLYEPSKRRLIYPNGAIITAYSADEPDLLRGPQHDFAGLDEFATWQRAEEALSNLEFGLRLGWNPRKVICTTPRPIRALREIIARASTVTTRGTTFDNAQNLAPSALAEFRARHEGTRIGRQELMGELLDDVPGALWQREMLDRHRVKMAPDLVRVVVAIDPAVSNSEGSAETGIIVAGKGVDQRYYVLADVTCHASPEGWARKAIAAFDVWKCDRVIGESNQGGAMVEATLRAVREGIPYTAVHASRGKITRAEPISALYESGKASHVGGFPELEDQLCAFAPEMNAEMKKDRADALVWALTELSGSAAGAGLVAYYREEAIKAGWKEAQA